MQDSRIVSDGQVDREPQPAGRESPGGSELGDSAKECFVVAPIGSSDSDTRRRSDQILKHVIAPVARERGFTVVRSDRIDQSGSITTQIINHILNAFVVVADLTDHNPNVFYELAVRHAAAKPFVQLIQEGQTIPFDIANYRTVFLDHKDLDSAAAARDSIDKMFADSLESNGGRVDSPISQAVDFEGLRASGDPQQRELAHISVQIRQLAGIVSRQSRTPEDDPDYESLRDFVVRLAVTGRLTDSDRRELVTQSTSGNFDQWIRSLPVRDPWATSTASQEDPWATSATSPTSGTRATQVYEEPPF